MERGGENGGGKEVQRGRENSTTTHIVTHKELDHKA